MRNLSIKSVIALLIFGLSIAYVFASQLPVGKNSYGLMVTIKCTNGKCVKTKKMLNPSEINTMNTKINNHSRELRKKIEDMVKAEQAKFLWFK